MTRDRSLHHSLPTPCSLQHPLRPQGPRVSVCPYQSISTTRRVTGPCSHCRHGSNDYLQPVQPPAAHNQSFSKALFPWNHDEEDLHRSLCPSDGLSGHYSEQVYYFSDSPFCKVSTARMNQTPRISSITPPAEHGAELLGSGGCGELGRWVLARSCRRQRSGGGLGP